MYKRFIIIASMMLLAATGCGVNEAYRDSYKAFVESQTTKIECPTGCTVQLPADVAPPQSGIDQVADVAKTLIKTGGVVWVADRTLDVLDAAIRRTSSAPSGDVDNSVVTTTTTTTGDTITETTGDTSGDVTTTGDTDSSSVTTTSGDTSGDANTTTTTTSGDTITEDNDTTTTTTTTTETTTTDSYNVDEDNDVDNSVDNNDDNSDNSVVTNNEPGP